MSDDELDRIFSAEQGIVPSANFARNVMAKVRTGSRGAATHAFSLEARTAGPGFVCPLSGGDVRGGVPAERDLNVCTKRLVRLSGWRSGRDCYQIWSGCCTL